MEIYLAKFNIEKAVKEMLRRPLGSDFIIFSEEPEKIIQLSKIVAFYLGKKEGINEQLLYFIYDCKSKTLTGHNGESIVIKTNDDEFILRIVGEKIGNKTPCVLVILNFDLIHADKRINLRNQQFIKRMKGNEAGKAWVHSNSTIIAGFSGKGSMASDLYIPSFELV